MDSMLDLGIFETRELEELRRSVFVSDISDIAGNKTKGQTNNLNLFMKR
jgi:hypothetical protein